MQISRPLALAAVCLLCGCVAVKTAPPAVSEAPYYLLAQEVQKDVAFEQEFADIAIYDPGKPVLEPPQAAPVITLAENSLDGKKEGKAPQKGQQKSSLLVETAEGHLLDTRVRRQLARAEEEASTQRRHLLELERRLEKADLELERERAARQEILEEARKLQAEHESLLAERQRLTASLDAPTPRNPKAALSPPEKPKTVSLPLPLPSPEKKTELQKPSLLGDVRKPVPRKLEKSWLFRVTARPGENFVLCRLSLERDLPVVYKLAWIDAYNSVIQTESGNTILGKGMTTIRGTAPVGAEYARLHLKEK